MRGIMKSILLAILGFVLGAIVGGTIAIGIGLAWINLARTSCFEGYCGYVVFTTFAPIGALLGAISGAAWLVRLGKRRAARSRGDILQ